MSLQSVTVLMGGPDAEHDVSIQSGTAIATALVQAGTFDVQTLVIDTPTVQDIENIHIGEGSNIQDGSVLHTDPGYPLKVGKNVTVGHLVMLHGCTIGDNSLIGIGAVILNNAKIGNNCVIGAKSLITENKEIPDNSLVVGSPGRVIRKVTDEEIKSIKENAIRYQKNWKKYLKSSIK